MHLGTSTRAAARRARASRASRVEGIVVGQWHLGILWMPLLSACWLSTLPQDRVEHTHVEMVRQALTLSLIALHCAIGAGYKTGKVVSCNA